MRHSTFCAKKIVASVCAVFLYFLLFWAWKLKRVSMLCRAYRDFKSKKKKLLLSSLLDRYRVDAWKAFELIRTQKTGCFCGDWDIPTKDQLDGLKDEISRNEEELIFLVGKEHFFVWIFDDNHQWCGYNPFTCTFDRKYANDCFFDADKMTLWGGKIPQKAYYYVYAVRFVPDI